METKKLKIKGSVDLSILKNYGFNLSAGVTFCDKLKDGTPDFTMSYVRDNFGYLRSNKGKGDILVIDDGSAANHGHIEFNEYTIAIPDIMTLSSMIADGLTETYTSID